MIFTKLNGGLGNQLFQYAAARRLAIHHRASVKLDVSYLVSREQRITHRNYALGPFKINATFASPLEISEISGHRKNLKQSILILIRKALGLSRYRPNCLNEEHFHFCQEILCAPDNIYLVGFWQSERYFIDVSKQIRSDLRLKTPLTGKNQKVARQIQSNDRSVFIHIRRGDYVSHPDVNKLNGICDLNYYKKSLEQLVSLIGKPHLFVFSDDPRWARENLQWPYPITFVDHNGPDDAHEDLRLMSLCRHAIIANSTFSWWGAWLIERSDKIIFAPRKWFATSQHDTKDLLPESWRIV